MNQNQPTSPAMGNKPKIRPWLLITLIAVILAAAGYFAWQYMQKKALVGPSAIETPIVEPAETDTTTPPQIPVVTPTPTTTPEPTVTPTTTPSTTSTTPSTTFKNYEDSYTGFNFQYPDNWFLIKQDQRIRIANKKSCYEEIKSYEESKIVNDDTCQIVTFFVPNSPTGMDRARTAENSLKNDSYYIKDTITSGNITVNTYLSSAKQDFQAYFDDSLYHAYKTSSDENSNSTIDVMKKILATVKIAPAQ